MFFRLLFCFYLPFFAIISFVLEAFIGKFVKILCVGVLKFCGFPKSVLQNSISHMRLEDVRHPYLTSVNKLSNYCGVFTKPYFRYDVEIFKSSLFSSGKFNNPLFNYRHVSYTFFCLPVKITIASIYVLQIERHVF